jgi:hypothetical protein
VKEHFFRIYAKNIKEDNMYKNLLILLSFIAIMTACNTGGKKETREITKVGVAEFETRAAGLVDSLIQIQGTVSHTCKEGGKRMFIFDENPDILVKIDASDKVDKFDAELEGNDVLVEGYIRELRIDETYLSNWEKELGQGASGDVKVHTGIHGGGDADSAERAQIEGYRTQIMDSGTDHLSFYSVECIKLEILTGKEKSDDSGNK